MGALYKLVESVSLAYRCVPKMYNPRMSNEIVPRMSNVKKPFYSQNVEKGKNSNKKNKMQYLLENMIFIIYIRCTYMEINLVLGTEHLIFGGGAGFFF